MNDEVTGVNLEEAYRRLERRLRNVRRGLALLASLVVVLGVILVLERYRVPADLAARGFSLVDESGKVVAHLARTTAGGGVLVLESKDGAQKAFLGILDDAVGLGLLSADRTRASLTLGSDGLPALTVTDAEGHARIVAGLDAKELPSISLWNAEGRLNFLARPGYSPVLQVFDDDGSSLFAVRPKRSEDPDREKSPKDAAGDRRRTPDREKLPKDAAK